MDDVNIISAYLHNRQNCQTATVYQYNQGMILRIIGPELPTAYEVDFANSVTGQSITQIGNENGVPIPDQFFTPGSMIHAWVVLTGEDYVVTRYHIMIPISPRAVRTSEEPTPSQQGAIDQAIAALNQAVEDAEIAITHYPTVIDGYWNVWDVTAGEYVSTGVAAQGPQGTPGQDGTDGTDGYSPTVTVTDIMGGHRVTVTDADGTHVFDVLNGTDGQDGSPGTDGADGQSAYVWIRYSATQPTQDSDMKTTPDAWIGIYSGDSSIAPTAYTVYTWYNIKGQTGPVSDVQVNGTSVVTDGVANVPVADGSNMYGVVKVNNNETGGIKIQSGTLSTAKATESEIKTGTQSRKPIVPVNQHEATFYGMAKAAGDTTQSASSNAVGNYTESAKSAIQRMLGVKKDWQLIATDELTEDATKYYLALGDNYEEVAIEIKNLYTTNASGQKSIFVEINRNAINGEDSFVSAVIPVQTTTYPTKAHIKLWKDDLGWWNGEIRSRNSAGNINGSGFMGENLNADITSISAICIHLSTATSNLMTAGTKFTVYAR